MKTRLKRHPPMWLNCLSQNKKEKKSDDEVMSDEICHDERSFFSPCLSISLICFLLCNLPIASFSFLLSLYIIYLAFLFC